MPEGSLTSARHYADPQFWECVAAALANPEFLQHWSKVNKLEVPVSRIRDARTNKYARRDWLVERFLSDVKEVIYDRVW